MSDRMDDEPEFGVSECNCGGKDCHTVVFSIIRPIIGAIEGIDETAFMCQFPLENAQDLVNEIRKQAAKIGIEIK